MDRHSVWVPKISSAMLPWWKAVDFVSSLAREQQQGCSLTPPFPCQGVQSLTACLLLYQGKRQAVNEQLAAAENNSPLHPLHPWVFPPPPAQAQGDPEPSTKLGAMALPFKYYQGALVIFKELGSHATTWTALRLPRTVHGGLGGEARRECLILLNSPGYWHYHVNSQSWGRFLMAVGTGASLNSLGIV